MGHNLKFKKMEIPEAIKLIQEMKSWMPSDNKNFDKEREAIDTVVEALEKPLPTDGWTSTLVKIPEGKQKVLAYNGYRIVHTSWQKFTDQDDNWFRTRYTHWMPMVELPREEEPK